MSRFINLKPLHTFHISQNIIIVQQNLELEHTNKKYHKFTYSLYFLLIITFMKSALNKVCILTTNNS